MNLLRFLKTGAPESLKSLLIKAGIASLANVVLIWLINSAAEQAAMNKPIPTTLPILYLNAFAIYYIATRGSMSQANVVMERLLCDLRVRIANKVRRSELGLIENIGRGELYTKLTQEASHLSQTFPLLVNACQQFILLCFCLVYILYLSSSASVLILGATVAGAFVFIMHRRALDEQMLDVTVREAETLDSITHFLEGFQEIRLNAAKNEALFEEFGQVVDRLEDSVVGIGRNWVMILMFSNAFVFALLGVIIFVLPQTFGTYSDIIFKVSAAALFCVGPVTSVVTVAPLYTRASVGLQLVFALEERLDAGIDEASGDAALQVAQFRDFQTISCRDVAFAYRDASGVSTFEAGPLNLTLERGKVLFLVGGNGSGKSTALKLISGLYQPERGHIFVDQEKVDSKNLSGYRELFSCIFADFHLFDRLYGLEGIDPDEVQVQIERMELADKVQFSDGRFSTLALSTGQRKRLALIAALLEDREVYIYDEWAADQDVQFREFFYTQILPDQAKQGKAIVVVTHDDRYWHLADQIVKLDLGGIVEQPTS